MGREAMLFPIRRIESKNVDSVLRESMIESSNNITNNIIEDFNILASGLTGWEPRSTVKWMRTQSPDQMDDNTVMILPQVHLRKPCYDFSFL